ncbi:NACHT domain-containing protein [Actinoplanes regularis]|uniref:NACHT domain-containing protein n=1 Tax=Actinoplanes regularis TaxID=52697 RepID=A0A239BVT9_9ACTN|nr:hypothetical protein [Actinoplanes regularis]GIE88252.1 hypothetical protein Are01nite_47320 [Actinoplanes regularis]SNS12036.1 hypothetical protein SAMN06264365_110163 [Actinoplanes regularis]
MAVLAAVAILLAGWMAVGDAADNDVRASVASLFVGLCALALTVLDRPAAPPPAEPAQLADDLAATVNQQWLGEARIRDLRDPQVLPLVWTRGGAGSGEAASPLFRVDVGAFDAVTRQLARAYRSVPAERLVVLGEPGAGKSVVAVLLTLGLLAGRAAGDRVPVLLSASSWDPVSQTLPEWIVATLAAAYYDGDPRIARTLLDDDLVVPILDGLDEIPETSRRSAIRRINEAVGAHRPIIVTCRSAEYTDVLRNGAPALHQAPVVTVQPVSGEDLASYVALIGWPGHVDWKPVLAAVDEEPGGALARALSTPLMISVARAVYQNCPAPACPTELLDRERFENRHAIEDHLVDRLVTTSFAAGQDQPARWPAHKARRWLTFLADHLHRHRERDLSWWRLADRLLSPWAAPAVGLAIGLPFMTGVSVAWGSFDDLDEDPFSGIGGLGAVVGLVMTLLATVLWYAAAGAVPSRVAIAVKGSAGRLRAGFLAGFSAVALLAGLIVIGLGVAQEVNEEWEFFAIVELANDALVSLALAVVAGAGASVHALLQAPPERSRQITPAGRLRSDRRSSMIGAAVAGSAVAMIVAPAVMGAVVVGTVIGESVAGWWFGLPGTPAVWSRTDFVIDRETIFLAVLCGLCCTVLVLLGRAWPRFLVLRVILAVRGQAPWRLMAFLAEAHRRDLLRESGGVYQFRHIRLQERLTEQAGAVLARPRTAAGPSTTPRTGRRRLVAAGVVVILVAGGGLAKVMSDHLQCRPASVMPAPVERLRIFTEEGSACYGVIAEQRWDALGPPRPPGAPNAGRHVLDQLLAGNRSARAGAPAVVVVGRFSDPDPIGYEYVLQQLTGVAVAQASSREHARVVLFDVGEDDHDGDGRYAELLRAWRSETGLSAVINLEEDSVEYEKALADLTQGEPDDEEELTGIDRDESDGDLELSSALVADPENRDALYRLTHGRRAEAVVPVVPLESEDGSDFNGLVSGFDDWKLAGANVCLGKGKSIGVYLGPDQAMDDFLGGARRCSKPPPLLIWHRAAINQLLRRSASDYLGWTFYYSTPVGASVADRCHAIGGPLLGTHRRIFPGQGDACTALLAGGPVPAYRAMRVVQEATGIAHSQSALDKRMTLLSRHYADEATVVIRVTADARSGRWKLQTLEV